MSFYTLDRNNQIYGDYIKRLGDIVKSYDGKYEVTLAISTLQSLLTVLTESKLYSNQDDAIESLSYAEGKEKVKIINTVISKKSFMGISESSIIENTFDQDCTIKDILKHMRNALSHPVSGAKNRDTQITGFYTVQGSTIEEIVFTDAPDSDSFKLGNPKNFEKYKEGNGFPKSAYINKVGKENMVLVDGKVYRRYIKIKLSTVELKLLVLSLCELFSEFITKAEDPSYLRNKLSNKFAA